MPDVTLCEMSPRDGLQVLNRKAVVPLRLRIQLIERLQAARLPFIEVGSFVNPKYMPAMADTAELAEQLKTYDGQLAALVPSVKYLEPFTKAAPPLTTVAIFLSASEAYSLKNTGKTAAQAIEAAREVADRTRQHGYRLRAHVSGAFRDLTPENQPTPEAEVFSICKRLHDLGCEVVSLADTDGTAGPNDMERLLGRVRDAIGLERIALHLHDRYGWGLVNAMKAYELGVRIFDASVGGIGGNKAGEGLTAGNIATEELVSLFESIGVDTGIDLKELVAAGKIIYQMTEMVGDLPPPSKFLHDRLGGA